MIFAAFKLRCTMGLNDLKTFKVFIVIIFNGDKILQKYINPLMGSWAPAIIVPHRII